MTGAVSPRTQICQVRQRGAGDRERRGWLIGRLGFRTPAAARAAEWPKAA